MLGKNRCFFLLGSPFCIFFARELLFFLSLPMCACVWFLCFVFSSQFGIYYILGISVLVSPHNQHEVLLNFLMSLYSTFALTCNVVFGAAIL